MEDNREPPTMSLMKRIKAKFRNFPDVKGEGWCKMILKVDLN